MGCPLPALDDKRAMLTSAGLLFYHMIGVRRAGKHVHHASVSIPGQITTHAVGERLILLWAKLLGVGYERLVLEASKTTTVHRANSC
jgi:hypothetical protein